MKLYIRRNEKDFGPYPIDQLKQLLKEGKLVRNDQASKDKIVWIDLAQFLDAKDNEASISEPPSIEDISKDSQEIVSAKSISESAPEESESIAPKQKNSSMSSTNKQPDTKVAKPISSFQENSNTKPKKKLLGVFVYSVIVLFVGFTAFFLGTLVDSSGKDSSVAVNTNHKTEEEDKIRELMTQVASLQEKVSENDELKSRLSTLESHSETDQQKDDQIVVSKSTIRNPFDDIAEIKAKKLDMKYQVHFFGGDINSVCLEMTNLSKKWDPQRMGILFTPPPLTVPLRSLPKYNWQTNSKNFIDVIKEIGNKYNVVWEFKGGKVIFNYIENKVKK